MCLCVYVWTPKTRKKSAHDTWKTMTVLYSLHDERDRARWTWNEKESGANGKEGQEKEGSEQRGRREEGERDPCFPFYIRVFPQSHLFGLPATPSAPGPHFTFRPRSPHRARLLNSKSLNRSRAFLKSPSLYVHALQVEANSLGKSHLSRCHPSPQVANSESISYRSS